MNVYMLGRTPSGHPRSFDDEVILNVLHQFGYPMLGIDLAVERCAEMLLFQCQTDHGGTCEAVDSGGLGTDHALQEIPSHSGPQLSLISAGSRDDADGACWLPNATGVDAMLASAGLEVLAHSSGGVSICRRGLAASDRQAGAGK